MAKEQTTPIEQQGKLKVLEETLNAIRKAHGKEAIMKLGEGAVETIEAIPTGILSLDYILGIGGFPRGRITEIFGPEASGKTSICLKVIAQAQKNGGIAAFIDAEHALDVNYAKKLGVDTANLLLSQPDFGEQALEIVDALVRSNAVDVIVIDSVAALVPRSEIEGEMGDPTMAVQARLMSQALRKITSAISKSKTCVIFTNQLRSKIGVMFGNPETTTGGNALKFYASLRIDVRKTQTIKDGSDVVGSTAKVKIVKSKVAPPFKEVEIDFLYEEGISVINDVLRLAVDNDIVKKSGAWFTYDNERYQGQEQFRKKLKENPELLEKLTNEVKEKLGMIKAE
ncbi:MAG TPA: recombinase RecA [Ignavibacteriales bacterium]|nr:recombinase RecA [Ignavibacteriales bacterium]HOL80392.1 recombinase RecA [Ignavibacteriales bacterium]HOM64843.1 recombinase RecA [Ignavibacteriales bacterium]HPD67424.1 recombinase RecA [Ignavibacteriales bacterium]HPP32581.1 recombinase RecA [Ignavibacteriales bacterium]